jgi:hypothetical protein
MNARITADRPTSPGDHPTSSGERVYRRGFSPLEKGTVEAFIARNGWVEVIWDNGPSRTHPKICRINELVVVPSTA